MKKILVIICCLVSFCGYSQEVDTLKYGDIIEIKEYPRFTGGEQAMFKFIANNISVPNLSIKNKVQGKVFVSFSLSEKGELYNIEIKERKLTCKKRDTSKCEEAFKFTENECIRIVKLMPNWIPGKINGIPKECKSITVPFSFKVD